MFSGYGLDNLSEIRKSLVCYFAQKVVKNDTKYCTNTYVDSPGSNGVSATRLFKLYLNTAGQGWQGSVPEYKMT